MDLPDFVFTDEVSDETLSAFTPIYDAAVATELVAVQPPIDVEGLALAQFNALAGKKPRKRRESTLSLLPLDVPDLSFLQVKPARETRNGVMRPEERTVTGIVWDIAQAIMQYRAFKEYSHIMPLVHEVKAAYAALLKDDANEGTCSTQYHGWVMFHGYRAEVDARRLSDEQIIEKIKADVLVQKNREAVDKKKAALEKKQAAAEKAAQKAAVAADGTVAVPKTRAKRKATVSVSEITPQAAELTLLHEEDQHALTLHTPPAVTYDELVLLAKQAAGV